MRIFNGWFHILTPNLTRDHCDSLLTVFVFFFFSSSVPICWRKSVWQVPLALVMFLLPIYQSIAVRQGWIVFVTAAPFFRFTLTENPSRWNSPLPSLFSVCFAWISRQVSSHLLLVGWKTIESKFPVGLPSLPLKVWLDVALSSTRLSVFPEDVSPAKVEVFKCLEVQEEFVVGWPDVVIIAPPRVLLFIWKNGSERVRFCFSIITNILVSGFKRSMKEVETEGTIFIFFQGNIGGVGNELAEVPIDLIENDLDDVGVRGWGFGQHGNTIIGVPWNFVRFQMKQLVGFRRSRPMSRMMVHHAIAVSLVQSLASRH